MSAQHIVMLRLAATCFLLTRESLAGNQIIVNERVPMVLESDLATSAPESSEPPEPARIHIRNDNEFLRDTTTSLNRFTFDGNVLRSIGSTTANWVVFFSTNWDEKCQQLLPSYRAIGTKMSAELNAGSLMSAVARFAVVDCGTDKELCNAQAIDRYPTVVHYRGGQRVSEWAGGSPGLIPFLRHGLKGTPLPGQGRKQRPGSVVRRHGEDASFDGEWDHGTIRGRTLAWQSGNTQDLVVISSTKVKTTIGSDVVEGELRSDGKLYWSNADVWKRAPKVDETQATESAATLACCRLAGLPCPTMPWGSFRSELPMPSEYLGGLLMTSLMGLVIALWLFPGVLSRRPGAHDLAAAAAAFNGARGYLPAGWARERRSIVL